MKIGLKELKELKLLFLVGLIFSVFKADGSLPSRIAIGITLIPFVLLSIYIYFKELKTK